MDRRRRGAVALTLAAMAAGVVGGGPATAGSRVTRAPVVAFQAAGDVGGGVLEPGTFFPPTRHGFALMRRDRDAVHVNLRTSGLPPGAYTLWWVVFDEPAGCTGPCDADDLFNPAARTSVMWATGGVVGRHGLGNFRASWRTGDDPGEPGTQHILGDGSFDPARAEIHHILKYHGPASADPALLWEQISTLLGGCLEGANAVDLGPPFGVQCFDPQAVAHPRP